MIKIILSILAIFFSTQAIAQNTLQIVVKDSTKNIDLAGASVTIKKKN